MAAIVPSRPNKSQKRMNFQPRLWILACLLQASSWAFAAGPAETPSHPLVGTWSWVVFGGSCTETWQFRSGKTVLSTSGEEVTEKSYTITPAADAKGFYTLQETVKRGNGKKDCSGAVAGEPGESSTRFVQFSPARDKMLVCEAPALTACFGPLRRLP